MNGIQQEWTELHSYVARRDIIFYYVGYSLCYENVIYWQFYTSFISALSLSAYYLFIKELFKDNNDINEKSVVGFLSFGMMVIALFVDLITGWMGKELLINEYIFNGFLVITLGSFGIASVDKYINRKAEHDAAKLDAESESEG